MLTQLLAKECSNCVHGDGAELHDNNQQTNNFVPQFQHRWLKLFVDTQSLLYKAEDMVEIVSICPQLSSTSSTWSSFQMSSTM